MSESNQNTNALLIHLSAFSTYLIPFPFISILMPLILWKSLSKDNTFIDHHGKEAVNFNLSFLLYNIILGVASIVFVVSTIFKSINLQDSNNPDKIFELLFSTGGFIFVLIAFGVLALIKIILIIIATISASNGELYRYPMSLRFIK